jgi:hypothetical protein
MEAITVGDVLGQSPLSAIECTPEPRMETAAMRSRIAVVGEKISPQLVGYLSQFYEVSKLLNLPSQGTEFDAVLEVRGDYCRARIRGHIEVTIPLGDYENLRRALRENLNR